MEAEGKPRPASARWERAREATFYVLGLLLIGGFVALYYTRFTGQQVVPPTVTWVRANLGPFGSILINGGVFVAFLAFLPYRSGIAWRSKGAVSAFLLALMAEMFGIPLMIYILSPLVGADGHMQIPGLRHLRAHNPHAFGWYGAVAGSWLILAGMIIILRAWARIHRAEGLITNGPYKHVRHPQYSGLALILTGWILHWGTLLTAMMYPVLLWTYYRLARIEERDAKMMFGDSYVRYSQLTPMFIPGLTVRDKTVK